MLRRREEESEGERGCLFLLAKEVDRRGLPKQRHPGNRNQ